jgi:hypothetical protein
MGAAAHGCRGRFLALPLAAAFLAGCASSAPPAAAPARWPSWVLQPDPGGGISAAECVESSGNLSVDRTQAAAAARVTLARNLEVNIQASDELSAVKSGQDKQAQNSQSFRSSAKLLTEKALANTRVSRIEEVVVDKRNWLCTEVSLDAAGSRGLVQQAVATTGTAPSADVEEMLLQQFRKRSVPAQAVQGTK